MDWTIHDRIEFERILLASHLHVEEINAILVKYGRLFDSAGEPYTVFAETINMLSSMKPVLRRQLQGAWDLAFSWVQAEPSSRHVAMPWQVLLAMITVALMWGLADVAGCLALRWRALLWAGELVAAKRRDVPLPRDVQETICFALLAINEPKTRRIGPGHQAAKLDIRDLLQVTDLASGDKAEGTKLWEQSGQTLRLRFKDLLVELDVGSLRSGGATWHLQVTEMANFAGAKAGG